MTLSIIISLGIHLVPVTTIGSLIPTSWVVSSRVSINPPGGGGGQSNTAGFNIVQTSFHDQHIASLAGSTVSTHYDFDILESLAEYNIQTQINCVNVGGNRPQCQASGTFNITPRTDVWVEATGSYAYSLPTNPTTANANFRVHSFPTDDVVFGDGFGDDTFLSGPHNGLYNLHASGMIPAGTPVQVSYLFRSDFLTGAANVAASSTGNLHFTMTPVPEPATLGPMVLFTLGLVRRRSMRVPH